MKHTYEKPFLVADGQLSEGVYLASGATASGGTCYTTTARIHQSPDGGGRGVYRIQVDGHHSATHHSTAQVLTLSFNLPVEYQSSNGALQGGDGTASISIGYNYHNNGTDNIGLGDVCVVADSGLAITGATISCNEICSQHDS